jgi:hypothetical protein
MTIYTICYTEDIGNLSDDYTTTEEGIKQLAINHYWGKLTKVPLGRLTVTLDMVLNIVVVRDNEQDWDIEYNIVQLVTHVA